MIFAFLEDGTLEVVASVADAQREYEGIDVESEAVRFYDQRGTYLEPVFNVPNRSGKILGLLGWTVSGTFDLVPNPAANQDSFALALYETSTLAPNPWFSSLHELKAVLRAQRVAVDFEPPGLGAT